MDFLNQPNPSHKFSDSLVIVAQQQSFFKSLQLMIVSSCWLENYLKLLLLCGRYKSKHSVADPG